MQAFFCWIIKSCVKGDVKFVAANWKYIRSKDLREGERMDLWIRITSLQPLWTSRFELLNVVAMVHPLWKAWNSGKTTEERGCFCWTVWVHDLCVRKRWRAASVSENRPLSLTTVRSEPPLRKILWPCPWWRESAVFPSRQAPVDWIGLAWPTCWLGVAMPFSSPLSSLTWT